MSDPDPIRERLQDWRERLLDPDARKDLAARETQILVHPAVRLLAGDAAPRSTDSPSGSGDSAPEVADKAPSFSILEADARQRAVIETVLRGSPLLVVEGPAGTGKTQTIVNLVAEAAARGRSALVVSGNLTALDTVQRRLQEAGLGSVCLEPRGGAVTTGAARPTPEPPLTPEEQERLIACRTRLDEYRHELAAPRWPLDRSIADVLGELASLHATPRLRWQPGAADLLTPELVEEILALVGKLEPLWHIVEAEQTPWERCVDPGAGAGGRAEWLQRLTGAARATQALKEVSQALAGEFGLPLPDDPGEASRLMPLDRLARRRPPVPAHWLRDHDLEVARDEAESWGASSRICRAERDGLRLRFRGEFFELPEAFPTETEAVFVQTYRLLGRSADVILGARGPLEVWLAATRKALPEWKRLAAQLSANLRLRSFTASIESSERLARIALLLNQPERPPAHWLDKRTCDKVEAAIQEMEAAYSQYRAARRGVHKDYGEAVADLDIDAVFADLSGGPLRWLSPRFHRARARLASVRHGGRAPRDPLGDLRKIRTFKRTAATMEKLRSKHKDLLGPLDHLASRGSLAADRAALGIARDILSLVTDGAELEGLAEFLREGAFSAEAASDAVTLERPLSENRLLQGKAEAALPAGPVPGFDEPLTGLPLDALEEWIEDLGQALGELGTRFGRLSALLAASDDRLTAEDAVEALFELASVRRFEARVASESGRLGEIFGGLFQGAETDWDSVLVALKDVEKTRDLLKEAPVGGKLPALASWDKPALGDLVEAALGAYEDLGLRFEQESAVRQYPIDPRDPWEAIFGRLTALEHWLDEREACYELARLRARIESEGLGGLLEELKARRVPKESLVASVRRAILAAWYGTQQKECLALKEFSREGHEALIDELGELERVRLRRAARALASACEGQPPLAVLASPAAASQLPTAFDLVLLDDASRIASEEAIASLSRGKQVVVFGDEGGGVFGELLARGAPRARLGGREAPSPRAPSLLEEDVGGVLRGMGYTVRGPLGSGRGTVRRGVLHPTDPERLLLALDFDDDTGFGWKRHRIWSPTWVLEREQEIGRLQLALLGAEESPAPAAAQPRAPAAAIEAVPYEAAKLETQALEAVAFQSPGNREAIARLLQEVAAREGPVHRDLAALRVLAAFGIGRRGRSVEKAVKHALRLAVEGSWLREESGFLYPPGARAPHLRTPVEGDPLSRREAAHIPAEEILMAAELALRQGAPLVRRKLLSRIGRLFGLERLGAKARSRFDVVVAEGARSGRLPAVLG